MKTADGIVTGITYNVRYMGKRPKDPSPHMDYFGKVHHHTQDSGFDFVDTEAQYEDDPDYDSVSIDKLLADRER